MIYPPVLPYPSSSSRGVYGRMTSERPVPTGQVHKGKHSFIPACSCRKGRTVIQLDGVMNLFQPKHEAFGLKKEQKVAKTKNIQGELEKVTATTWKILENYTST